MSSSTGWQACRDQHADRLAHVPADYTALMLANVEVAKVVQERLRHGSARITMGVYAQGRRQSARRSGKWLQCYGTGKRSQVEKVCVPAV